MLLALHLLLSPALAADLNFVDLEVADHVVEGRSFTFHVTVRNDGAAVAGDVDVTARSSSNASYDALSDTLICTDTIKTGLAAGATVEADVTCTWPTGLSGPRYLVAHADSPFLSDLNGANNDIARLLTIVPADAPDLVGRLDSPPTQVRVGESIDLAGRVDNDGETAAAATTARLLLSRDDALDPGDVALCEVAVKPIARHDHVDADLTGCLTPLGTTTGSAWLLLVADANHAVDEVDEDNVEPYPVTVLPPLPDLHIDALSAPASVLSLDTTSVDVKLSNDGFVDVALAIVTVRVSTDAIYDDTDTLLCSATLAGPAAGGTKSGTIPGCTFTAGIGVGTRTLVARVDSNHAIAERDETDNDASTTIEVLPRVPNLRISALSPPTDVDRGATISVPYTIVDDGDADVANTSLHVRLSADAHYDATDTLICGGPIAGVDQHDSRSDTLTGCVVPASTPLGLAYVVARVDPNDATAESDEADNDAFAEIDVHEPPDLRPDWHVTALTPIAEQVRGASWQTTVSITNEGLGATPETSIDAWLSSDEVLSDDDRFLCTTPGIAPIAPHDARDEDVGCIVPTRVVSGDWFVIVDLDPGDTVDEPNEDDDVGATPITIVDADTDVDTATPLDTDIGDTDLGDTDLGDTDLGDTDVIADTDVIDSDVIDTDTVETDRFPTESDVPIDDDDRAPARWFCSSTGSPKAALGALGLLALTALRRRRR